MINSCVDNNYYVMGLCQALRLLTSLSNTLLNTVSNNNALKFLDQRFSLVAFLFSKCASLQQITSCSFQELS